MALFYKDQAVRYLCGVCLRDWGCSEQAARACAESHPKDAPPANEDR